MAALVLLVSGYIFLIVSAIFGIAQALGVSWIWITLAAAGLHFILAIGCGLLARRQSNEADVSSECGGIEERSRMAEKRKQDRDFPT